jgi:hypothetical protein
MPDWRPLKGYSEADHAERLRAILRKRLDALPLKALVKLQEVAALLETGDRLDTFLAREKVGKRRGKVQVQRREDVDRGQRTTAATSVENAALEEEARAEVAGAVVERSFRFRARREGVYQENWP